MPPAITDLLRSLGSGVHAARGGSTPTPAAGNSLDSLESTFRTLLDNAKNGSVSSGLPVTTAPGANLELSADQLKRLADAADLAQASGATRALVMIDGLAVKLDVGVRTVTGLADMTPGKVVSGIDAVIQLPAKDNAGGPQLVRPPAAFGANASLFKALQTR